MQKSRLVAGLSILLELVFAVSGKSAVLWDMPDDPKLPNVLLIGDSISMQYHFDVQALLKGKANVHRLMESPTSAANGRSTKDGLKYIDELLGKKKWDVIHFNWGLHDLKYVDERGNPVAIEKGKHQVEVEQYAENLEKLVAKLKATKAKLIFATTTPVPEGAESRKAGDEKPYNEAALKIMKKEGIAVDDLYGFVLPQLNKIQKPRDVHFTREGSEIIGVEVTKNILKALGKDVNGVKRMDKKVKLETSKGDIVIALNEQAAPVTVKNFITYVNEGFYDGTIFHRVIKGFMIQGGGFTKDMQQKPTHAPITNEANNYLLNDRGSIAMARTNDPNSATAQFFINHVDNKYLNYVKGQNDGYAVFGRVVEGMDVVDAIASVKTTVKMMPDVPAEPVIIKSAKVIEDKK